MFLAQSFTVQDDGVHADSLEISAVTDVVAAGDIPPYPRFLPLMRRKLEFPAKLYAVGFGSGASLAGAGADQLALELGVLRRTAIRRLCGVRDYAKPLR